MTTTTGCPKCGSSDNGYSFSELSRNGYSGLWGEEPEWDDSDGRCHSRSLVKCNSCGAQFHYKALVEKGYVK